MSLIIVCEVCANQFPDANPAAFKKWLKKIKVKKQNKKFTFDISLESDTKDGDVTKKDFERIANPCARDIAKEIASEIVNA